MFHVLKRHSALVYCLAFGIMPITAIAAAPPPLSAYGRLPDAEGLTVSADGRRLASISTSGGKRVVAVADENPANSVEISLGDAKLRSIAWLGNDHLLIQTSQTENLGFGFTTNRHEFWQAMILPIGLQHPPRVVFARKPMMLNAVFGTFGQRRVKGEWVAYFGGVELARNPFNEPILPHSRPALFQVSAARDKVDKIASPANSGEWNDWLLAADGSIAATFTIGDERGNWSLRGPRGAKLAEGIHPNGDAGLLALGSDGSSVLYSVGGTDTESTRWYEVALDGRSAPREFLPDEEVERIYVDRTSGSMIGYHRGGSDGGPRFFAPEHQALASRIASAFAGRDWRLLDWTPNFSKALVHTSGNGDSGTAHLVELGTMQARTVGTDRPAIRPAHVGAISRVRYSASDGLAMDGILTLPPAAPRNLPVVLLPHGGPHAHDDENFDWWAQAFASRGYAVFQPNFRGSTGRGEAFVRAGYGQWGRAMQTDISDGLAELARQGIVDPARACIVGASYGGYAALAGVTLQQDLYRCAVSVAGISDVSLMFRTDYRESAQSSMLKRSLLEELGPRTGFDAISPLRFASEADAPILMIHGRDDTVVPYEQSSRMLRALEEAGKTVKLVELREEDHWLSRASTRLQMLEEAVAFVEQHNPAD